MKPLITEHHSIKSIALAEAGSTVVSMGALWAIERFPAATQPLKDYLTREFIYPAMAKNHPPADSAAEAALQQKAANRASILVKGAGMIGAGFAAHIPLQLALEGKADAKSFRTTVLGKSIGITTALGSVVLLDKIAPSLMPALQNALFPIVKPFLPKDERGRDARGTEEVAKLLILDAPSSIIAGLVNYYIGKKMR